MASTDCTILSTHTLTFEKARRDEKKKKKNKSGGPCPEGFPINLVYVKFYLFCLFTVEQGAWREYCKNCIW